MNKTPAKTAPAEAPPTLDQLAALVAHHEAEAAKHTNMVAVYKSQIMEQLGAPTKGVRAGNLLIDWTPPSRQFNAVQFMAAYPPDTNPTMYKLVPNSDAIPKNLKDHFMEPKAGNGTVKIK